MISQHTKVQNDITTSQNTKWKPFSHSSNISTYTVGKSISQTILCLGHWNRDSQPVRWEDNEGAVLNVRQWEDNLRQWEDNLRQWEDNGKAMLDNCNGEEAEKWRKCSAEVNRVVHSVVRLIPAYFISCLTWICYEKVSVVKSVVPKNKSLHSVSN